MTSSSVQEYEMGPQEPTASRPVHNDDEMVLPKGEHDNVVWWEGDNDPSNPFNWPAWVINVNCGLLTFLNFITPLASCRCTPPSPSQITNICVAMVAPGIPQIMQEFGNTSLELSAFVLSIYVLGVSLLEDHPI